MSNVRLECHEQAFDLLGQQQDGLSFVARGRRTSCSGNTVVAEAWEELSSGALGLCSLSAAAQTRLWRRPSELPCLVFDWLSRLMRGHYSRAEERDWGEISCSIARPLLLRWHLWLWRIWALSIYVYQGSFLSSGPDNYERSQNVRKVSEEQRLVQKMLKMRGMMLHTWIFMLEWTRKKKSTKNFLSMQQYCASMAVQASLCNGKLAHVWKQDKPETRGLSKTVRTPTKKGWKSRMEQVFLLKMRKKFSAVLLSKRMLI